MRKAKKLYILLGVLLALCAAAFAVSRYEAQKEQIKNSGEVILAIPTDSVTALSWTNGSGTFSFTKGEAWGYDADADFPVDSDKVRELLSQFSSFTATFAIDDAEDYAQYGLEDPVCTIHITAGEESYTVELGDFSKMDEQRYVSIGDGKVYLVSEDPYDSYSAVLRDMIHNDTIPSFNTASRLTFSGEENYTIVRDENGKSIDPDDMYFVDGKPVDTTNVSSYLSVLRSLSLTEYVSYNVSAEELSKFGLDEPDLTVELAYIVKDSDGNETGTGSLTLHISQNPEEAAAYEEAVQKNLAELPDVTCYVRVDQSHIVYKVSQDVYDQLTDVSYNTMRHQALFTADLDTVTGMDVSLNGESYTFTYTPPTGEDDEGSWTYAGKEFDGDALVTALRSLSASGFTSETPTGKEEISLTVHLDNADFPTFTLTLYRCDGTSCIAAVDGEIVALVSRSKTVDLIEAVNELTLGS